MTTFPIVGISGLTGSGKDTIADCFVSQGFARVSLADPMKRLLYIVFDFSEAQLWGSSDKRNAPDARFYPGSPHWDLAEERLASIGEPWVSFLLGRLDLQPETASITGDGRVAVEMRGKLDLQPDTTAAHQSLLAWCKNLRTTHPRVSPRVCLQTLGTDWGRDVLRDDIWIRYLQHVTGLLRTGFLSYSRTIGVHAFAVTTPPYYGVVVPDVRFDNEVEFFAEREYPILRVVRPDTDLMANTVGVQNHASEIASTAIDNRRFTAIIDNSGPLSHLLLTGEMLANVYRPRRAND